MCSLSSVFSFSLPLCCTQNILFLYLFCARHLIDSPMFARLFSSPDSKGQSKEKESKTAAAPAPPPAAAAPPPSPSPPPPAASPASAFQPPSPRTPQKSASSAGAPASAAPTSAAAFGSNLVPRRRPHGGGGRPSTRPSSFSSSSRPGGGSLLYPPARRVPQLVRSISNGSTGKGGDDDTDGEMGPVAVGPINVAAVKPQEPMNWIEEAVFAWDCDVSGTGSWLPKSLPSQRMAPDGSDFTQTFHHYTMKCGSVVTTAAVMAQVHQLTIFQTTPFINLMLGSVDFKTKLATPTTLSGAYKAFVKELVLAAGMELRMKFHSKTKEKDLLMLTCIRNEAVQRFRNACGCTMSASVPLFLPLKTAVLAPVATYPPSSIAALLGQKDNDY